MTWGTLKKQPLVFPAGTPTNLRTLAEVLRDEGFIPLADELLAYITHAESLERENAELRRHAITGWESARCLAICPPPFGAPATEKAADEALAKLRGINGEPTE